MTGRRIDRPTPEEIAYALSLITDPMYLPDDRERRASYIGARAIGLIQFAAGDTYADAETNLRRVRAAVIAERTALHELYPGQYNDTDPFDYEQETTHAEAPTCAGTVAPEPETEPTRPSAQAGPEGPAAAQARPAGPAAPEVSFDITTYGDAAAGRTELVDDGHVQRIAYICRRRHTHATLDYRDACNMLPGAGE